jgi:hypothetical protein
MTTTGGISIDFSVSSRNPNSPDFDPGSFVSNGTISADAQVNVVNPNVVPEPARVGLIIAALMLMGIAIYRRRSAETTRWLLTTLRLPRSTSLPGFRSAKRRIHCCGRPRRARGLNLVQDESIAEGGEVFAKTVLAKEQPSYGLLVRTMSVRNQSVRNRLVPADPEV